MRILDKNWPWHFLAGFLFIGAMALLRYIAVGFNEDFGMGFCIGVATGILIAFLAVGWSRGEMKQVEVLPPLSQSARSGRETGDG